MESALRPREIQDRIRGGESVEEVAAAASLSVDKIIGFATPVLAERDNIAALAHKQPVRRPGESTSSTSLGSAVAEHLTVLGVDSKTAAWDAWQREKRIWTIRVRYHKGDETCDLLFTYDQIGRFSTAFNEAARLFLSNGAAESAESQLPDDIDASAVDEETIVLSDRRWAAPARYEDPTVTDYLGGIDDASESDDAFADAELTEVDGVYDLVSSGDHDVLYEMLSSINEDSARIYTGLVQAAPPIADPEDLASQPRVRGRQRQGENRGRTETGTTGTMLESEPEQPTLLGDQPRESEQLKKRKRASVPSWDQIMFGSPRDPATFLDAD